MDMASPNVDLKDMVERVPWMRNVDYAILEFYSNHDIVISPSDLARNIDFDSNYIGKRLRKLRDAGLFEQDGPAYQLTDKGRAFIDGEIGADELPEPE